MENLSLVWGQIDYAVGNDDVDRVVSKGQVVDLSQPKLHVSVGPAVGILAGLVNHLGCHVHTDDFARFAHFLSGQKYIEAFETIIFIEKVFGSQLRDYAIRISRERYALRQKALQTGFEDGSSCKKPD